MLHLEEGGTGIHQSQGRERAGRHFRIMQGVVHVKESSGSSSRWERGKAMAVGGVQSHRETGLERSRRAASFLSHVSQQGIASI